MPGVAAWFAGAREVPAFSAAFAVLACALLLAAPAVRALRAPDGRSS
jgi:hypothetical protein